MTEEVTELSRPIIPMPTYIAHGMALATWFKVIEVATGQPIEHVVAANTAKGWVIVETGEIIDGAVYEQDVRMVEIRFDLDETTAPKWARRDLGLDK